MVYGVQMLNLALATLELESAVQEPFSSQRHGIDFSEDSIIAEHLPSKHHPAEGGITDYVRRFFYCCKMKLTLRVMSSVG